LVNAAMKTLISRNVASFLTSWTTVSSRISLLRGFNCFACFVRCSSGDFDSLIGSSIIWRHRLKYICCVWRKMRSEDDSWMMSR
jgi:hypothetical protein